MNIDWFTFVAQIVNFVVLIWLLNRFLYGPITRAMQARQESVAEQLRSAQEQQRASQREKEDYEQRAAELATERQAIVSAAREEATHTKQSLLNEARNEVQDRRNEWLQSLEREQHAVIRTVCQYVSKHVLNATRSALAQLAGVDLEERMVSRFIELLGEDEKLSLLQRESAGGNPAIIETAFEISEQSKDSLQTVLHRQKLDKIDFETDRDLVCGIELHIGGHKIGWSVQEYLVSLEEEIAGMSSQGT